MRKQPIQRWKKITAIMHVVNVHCIISGCFGLSLNNGNGNNYNNNGEVPRQTTRNIATQILQGTGPSAVDLNTYNLPLEVIEEGYCAAYVQKNVDREEGIYLGAKDEQNHYVDVESYSIPRRLNEGMGIELVEVAGGRNDGVGITLVSGLLEDGPAEFSGLMPGDSIVEVSLVRKTQNKSQAFYEQEQIFSVRTECLSYDATVAAILSLPECEDNCTDSFLVKVKRLRRRAKVRVKLQYPPEQKKPDEFIELRAGENLRQGMLVRGVKLNDPLAQRFDTKSGGNCGAGGLCRTCSVCVTKGSDLLNPQRVAEKQMLCDNPRWRLACKAIVGYGMKEGEMTVQVNPNQW